MAALLGRTAMSLGEHATGISGAGSLVAGAAKLMGASREEADRLRMQAGIAMLETGGGGSTGQDNASIQGDDTKYEMFASAGTQPSCVGEQASIDSDGGWLSCITDCICVVD